jgi:hypothetical protein
MVIFAEPLIKFSVNKINKMFMKLFAILPPAILPGQSYKIFLTIIMI